MATAPATWSGFAAAHELVTGVVGQEWVRALGARLRARLAGGSPPDDPRLPGPITPGPQTCPPRRYTRRGGPRSGWHTGPGRHDGLFRASNGDRATIAVPAREPRVDPLGIGKALARRVIQAISGRTGRTLWNHSDRPGLHDDFVPRLEPAGHGGARPRNRRWSRMSTASNGSASTRRPANRAGADRSGVRARPAGPVCGPGWRRRARDPGDGARGRSADQPDAGRVFARYWPKLCGSRPSTSSTNSRLIGIELPSDWPLVVDLDGDGRSELVIPDSGSMPSAGRLPGRARHRWINPA